MSLTTVSVAGSLTTLTGWPFTLLECWQRTKQVQLDEFLLA